MRLNGFHIKWIALLTMTLDHIAFFLLPLGSQLFLVLRLFGRISFPLFAFLVSQAIHHSRRPWIYVFRLFAFGVMIESVVFVSIGSFYGNIFLTLALGALAGNLVAKRNGWSFLAIVLVFVQPLLNIFRFPFQFQYGDYGILLIVLLSLFHSRKHVQAMLLVGVQAVLFFITPNEWLLRVFSSLSAIVVLMYDGKPGFRHPVMKTAFYLYYPLHLLAILAIRWFVI